MRHLRKPHRILDQAISLHHLFPNNYFHFFNNIASKLPLVEAVNLAQDIPLLVPADLARQRYFQGSRELGLFGDRPIIVQSRDKLIAASAVYVVKAHDCTLATQQWICERLGVHPDSDADNWVYIERGKGSPNARYFRNNAELHRLLAGHGIRSVDPQALSLAEQIAVFANARVVISAHGAGLTNIIFRGSAPCTVVELFNPSFGTPHYYLTALQHGFEYHWLDNRNESREKGLVASSEADLAALDRLIHDLKRRIPTSRRSPYPTGQ
ncbi:MAG: glycosyltransferase family 61 protein [Thiobacillus sp.]|nr:glycosyltransferase family 61 protein [Thiobacillus sp.]